MNQRTNPETIDFRSDTKTLPTREMLDAMLRAELGDSKSGEDPTVLKLQELAARRLGKEAALLVISGTMGNLVAHMALAASGDAIVLDRHSHAHYYEGGSFAIGGRIPVLVEGVEGRLDPSQIEKAVRSVRKWTQPRLLHLENTHVLSGGRVIPLDLHRKQSEAARKHGLSIHLDGARLFNAEAATGSPAAAYAAHVDTVSFCLSKSLSCPLGAVLCGSREVIEQAKFISHRIGGGMRQAGIIAAAGIVALETMIDRLKEDHANARRLAEGVNHLPGFSVNIASVESNMLRVDSSRTGKTIEDWQVCFKKYDVLVGNYPDCLRFVTHRHHTPEIIDEALRRMRKAVEK